MEYKGAGTTVNSMNSKHCIYSVFIQINIIIQFFIKYDIIYFSKPSNSLFNISHCPACERKLIRCVEAFAFFALEYLLL